MTGQDAAKRAEEIVDALKALLAIQIDAAVAEAIKEASECMACGKGPAVLCRFCVKEARREERELIAEVWRHFESRVDADDQWVLVGRDEMNAVLSGSPASAEPILDMTNGDVLGPTSVLEGEK